VKADHGSFMTTVALFQIKQPSGITDPQTLVFSVDGERRHQGIELNTFGSPVNGFRLLGGMTLMDAELTKTQGGSNDGRTPAGVSKFRASLGGEWDAPFLERLTFTVRGVYNSSFYVDTANRIEAPSYTVMDLGVRYSALAGGKPLAVRLNVENVFDKAYWNSFDLVRGAPRTVLLSGTVAF
jgi:iron complex outermembrane recepter protein